MLFWKLALAVIDILVFAAVLLFAAITLSVVGLGLLALFL